MTRRTKIFCIGIMILILSVPLYMDYLLASHELGIYFLDNPGLRGPFLMLPKLLCKIGISIRGSCKLYIFGMNFLTCVISYFCFEKIAKQSISALAGSICYSFSLYSIYIRYKFGSMGEMAAYAVLPLVLYGFWSIYTLEKSAVKSKCWLLFGLTILFYAQIPIALIVISFCILCSFLLGKKSLQKERFFWLITSFFGSILFSLPVLVPYLKVVRSGNFWILDGSKFADRGLEIAQVFQVFWGKVWLEDTISMEVFPTLGLPFLVAFGGGIFLLLQSKKKTNYLKIPIVIALIAVIISLRIFPWESIASLSISISRLLEQIGYPYRFLIVAVLALSILLAWLGDIFLDKITEEQKKEEQARKIGIFLVAVIAMNFFSGVYFMDNMLYLTPLDHSYEVTEAIWTEGDYLLYLNR